MKRNTCLSLFVLILFFSCSRPHNILKPDISGMETITIDPQHGFMLPMDSFIEEVKFIQLETTNNNLIGNITQLLFTDSLLIVIDAELSKAIYFFDTQGNYMRQISQKGNGPGEYVEISHVSIAPDKKQLAILDRMQNKIIYYDLNGEYVSSEKTPFQLSYFEYLDSGGKAYEISRMDDPQIGEYKDNSLVVTNSKNHIIYGAFRDINNPNFTFSKHLPLRKFQETVYFSPNFSDTIYTVNDTTIAAKYHIDFRQNKMPDWDDNITDRQFQEYCEKFFFFNGDFIELEDFTYVNIVTPWGYPGAIYSHKRKETFLSSGKGNHPFFSFLNTAPKARYKDNALVVDVQAYMLHAGKQELYKNDGYHELLDSLFENLTEDSNPVLFFYSVNPNM